ncbi:flagellar biosynthesis protein FlhF [Desulfitibacter alkalitolerans]|uniref:flagellar biosynthesis protein FlhF n=1 Tax=Desulfitibacter alkalitolerans TaxID=264641 RepID=UPI0004844A5D|nr:flagellar biosynthesis protein FlhF [Desulfitibacter alkalitolerans]
MKIKKYLAYDMKEACQLIRQDLGPDAVIINTKQVRQKGILGFIKARMVEVTAAVDEVSVEAPSTKEVKETLSDDDKVSREMQEMKELLQQIIFKEQKATDGTIPVKVSDYEEFDAAEEFRRILEDLDLLPEVEKKIQDAFLKNELDQCKSRNDIKDKLAEKLADFFIPVTQANQKSNVLAFIGPTGVGKTTTIAKLAANFALYHGLNIALITIDTYRIGAVAQLKTYGDIIGVTVEAVMTPLELKETVKNHKHCDLILVDTAGRSSKNFEQITELKTFLDAIRPLEVYLVLDVNTKNKDLISIVDKYSVLKYSKLVFTKADETYSLGSILNVVDATELPVAYVTNGQNVPDDIIPGEPAGLAKLIIEEVE